ncbi:hypothetical protein P175DRAFT_0502844 [Aspergillus ochraceoroseus IBT 24754]|uniref:Uncharacterized protein n=2 Tax=Aspergillus ochraceoroseus TaxID=138278 RepID=A0A2T5LSQ5_9EURO|nr:uncharacterized protein P175DRAFT_0502844 [Aspergillus ochraceoroseus IBT 24754]KKK19118.1 hypothetical protein AOCH_002435 [Aspergillus ochraceoroseus]PTU19314.1 hypothetical protein P175DRAFT_0502844 [Aspergillus ochraceoroseus IBT 24754]
MLLPPPPTLLLPNLPPKTLVGMDLIAFTSTPNFHGIRDIPPGWHFVYTGATEVLSLRCGGWFYVSGTDHPDHTLSDSRVVTISTAGVAGNEPEIRIWRWNPQTETLEPLSSAEKEQHEAMRYKANLGRVWQSGGLFGYRSRVPRGFMRRSNARDGTDTNTGTGGPSEGVEEEEEDEQEQGRRDWNALTDRFSGQLLTRVTGEPKLDCDGRPRWVVTSASTAKRDSDDIPGLGPGGGLTSGESRSDAGAGTGTGTDTEGEVEMGKDQENEFSFLPVDLKMTWREGAIGRERTEAARDRSWALGDIIHRVSLLHPGSDESSSNNGESQVLGELQFTFLMGLTLMNYSCLQQWKRLLRLILTCRRAIVERETFMRDVLRLLLLQLKRCDDIEGGFFDLDGEEGGEFLRKLLKGFRGALYEVLADGMESPVKAEFDRLETWVKNEYDWELDREAVVRRGMLQLEDGEQVEIDMNEDDEDDETGEYAPVIVDLGDQSHNSQ